MKNFRKVVRALKAPEVQMGEIKLRQAIPVEGLEQISPFILLHHFDFSKGPGEHNFHVPPHPHRGFSPITFMFEGSVQHKDSLGNDAVIGDNEVQWINAARGIIHEEKANKEFVEKGGRFQGIQLWINTPRAHKMDPPSYQPITKKEIVLMEQPGVEFRLVSGEFDGKKGPAHSDVITAMLRMEANSNFTISLSKNKNVTVYLLEGDLIVNEKDGYTKNDLVLFENSEGDIHLKAQKNSKLLLMAGEPINEPLVTYGPFVMTSQTEIMEAMRDYRDNKMGYLS